MPLIKTADRHQVTVKSAELGESAQGTPFIQLNFENAAGEQISGWLYLSDAAFKHSLKTLRDAFNFDGNFETVINQVTGKQCSITTEFEKYEGQDRLKVKWINSLRAPVKPMSGGSDMLKKLSAQAARIPVEASKKKDPF